MGSSICQKSEW